jgi:hypothetical protein
VTVLRSEIEAQIRHRQEILAKLAEYQPQDRAERSRKQAALARGQMMAGVGAIGKRMSRQRREAEEREKELRAIWAARDRETLSGGVIWPEDGAREKIDPENA